jgi:hypothetical protein
MKTILLDDNQALLLEILLRNYQESIENDEIDNIDPVFEYKVSDGILDQFC